MLLSALGLPSQASDRFRAKPWTKRRLKITRPVEKEIGRIKCVTTIPINVLKSRCNAISLSGDGLKITHPRSE
jgi:hypothetical protein